MTLSKAELIDMIAVNAPFTKKDITVIMEEMIEAISSTLERGIAVNLHQLGRLHLRRTLPRKARNPRTGEPMLIPAKRRVIFKPAKMLRDRVNRS
jgi:DNA-binding protein HU-beta